MTVDDMRQLRDYARTNSNEAFAALVARHINLVYSVALRHVRDPHQAEEITQVVFIILAKKAGALGPKTILAAWLCRTARYVSLRSLKMQQRRQAREQEAYMQSTLNEPEAAAWTQIAPLLDAALAELGEKDHNAVVLRFFEGKSFKAVGAALGANEDTAKKRVNRTLEKLRRFFLKRGVSLSTAVISGAVLAHSVQAAPASLANTVTTVALAKGAMATGSTFTLIKGAIKFMAWTKMKIAVVTAAVLLAGTGTTMVTVKVVERHHEDAVWTYIEALDAKHLDTAPPIVSIRPAQLNRRELYMSVHRKEMGLDKTVEKLLQNAYNVRRNRIIASSPLPTGSFDYLVTVRHDPQKQFQAAIREKFGLAGRKEMRETNVLILRKASESAPGLKIAANKNSDIENRVGNARFILSNSPISTLAFNLEAYLKIPVIDETGLTDRYDIDLKWQVENAPSNQAAITQATLDQLGLELTPAVRPIEMLIVEKAK